VACGCVGEQAPAGRERDRTAGLVSPSAVGSPADRGALGNWSSIRIARDKALVETAV
jgi:hypothetical protein